LGYSTFTKVYERATDNTNGTKVKIALKSYDKSRFVAACKEQLAYFDNVFLIVDGQSVADFNNAKRHVFKNFTYIEGYTPDQKTHIKLGQVYYPLDVYKVLGIYTHRNLPIALNFNIGDIHPHPSRESLIFTDEAKKLIKSRYKAAVDELLEMYKKQTDTLEWDHWYKLAKGYGNVGPKIGEEIINIKGSTTGIDFNLVPSAIKYSELNTSMFLNNWYYFRQITDTGMHKVNDRTTFNPLHVKGADHILTIENGHNKYSNKYIADITNTVTSI